VRTFTCYYTRDGLSSSVVEGILEDGRGDLWLSTSDGLSRFNPRTRTVRNYYVGDGLPGNEFRFAAASKSPAGEMFFGSTRGLLVFFPERVIDDPSPPPVVLTDFWLFGNRLRAGEDPLPRSISYIESITLGPRQNIFSFEFSALSYSNPTRNRYRYRLEALEEHWNERDSTQRLVTYTTLPPGDYVFRVQGSNSLGVWNENGARVPIRILPPWWRTWWFGVVAVAVALTLLGALYQWRIYEIQHRENELRAVVETIPTMAWTALPDGSNAFSNRRWQEYTGLSVFGTSSSAWHAVAHPEDIRRHEQKWRASLVTGEPFENEVRFRRASDGEYRWFLVRAVPLRDRRGKIVKWYGVGTDIEDHKRAEQERQRLLQLEADLAAKIRRLVDSNIVGVMITTFEGQIIDANDAFLGIVGYCREDLNSGRLRWTDLTPSEWQAATQRAVAQIRATGSCDLYEKEYARKDGSRVPVLVASAAIGNAESECVAFVLDLSERKAAESEVRRLNQQLEQRIKERTAQLAEANRQLAERNEELARVSRMKSEFLARMSHDLRTPLNSIAGFSDLLAEESEGPLGEVYSDYVQHVKRGAQHLLDLVNEILDLSRIEAGRIELHYEEFPAADAISDVLSVTRPLAEPKQIDLRNEVPSALHVHADRTRFKQILYNLVGNAVKFTPPEGMVGITAEAGDREIRFLVSDTGIGIPQEEHRAIFEEFHQVSRNAAGIQNGTGLGLAITKRLVELQGGRIWVESAPGEGSRFFFTMLAGCGGEEASADVRRNPQ
ncbi:MAG TPA: PAS domain S-box protein, partial [Bryobacteraceae bacterium]|nr:PAS domain S-box protein [Bryobacteraceae bacterium]